MCPRPADIRRGRLQPQGRYQGVSVEGRFGCRRLGGDAARQGAVNGDGREKKGGKNGAHGHGENLNSKLVKRNWFRV